MAQLSRWLEAESLDLGGLTSERVAQFCAARRSAGHTRLVTSKGLAPLLDLLRGVGVVPEAAPAVVVGAWEELLGRYRSYLVRERGLVERVVGQYEVTARLLLSGLMLDGGPDLSGLSSADVTGFVTRQCPLRGASAAKSLASSLRSFLRFLHVQGHIGLPLAQAVPSVARRGGGSLPEALGSGQAGRLLASCDRRSVIGRRDYAMLLLGLRLGLRAGEIVALTLDDIDWRAGEIVVRGKGRCQERLPLPADVGQALADYPRRGRPRTDHRTLFLRAVAPLRGLGPAAVSWVVYRACDRAGLPRAGAHRLRHTAATGMLRAGASLSDVGQVLRHRSAMTTAIYAKVDHDALGTLVRRGLEARRDRAGRNLRGLPAAAPLAGLQARAGRLLADFVAFCDRTGAVTVTTELALAWATLPPNGSSGWWAQRLGAVRGFAAYLQSLDPAAEVPPAGLLPARIRRAEPYLYSDDDVAGLMAAACRLRSPLRQATYATLVGLLAVTGLRVGEAIRLDRDDLCWDSGLLTVRRSKLDKSRQLPLHPTTVEALRGYARRRGPELLRVHRRHPARLLQRVVHVCDPRVPRRAGAPLATMPTSA